MAGVYYGQLASVEEAAVALAAHCEVASGDELATFLTHLGGMGPGLFKMLQQEPAVGPLFGALYNLNMLTEMVVVNQHTCQQLCMLGFDVLALLDNAGKRGVVMRSMGLQLLTACFDDICRVVDAFTQPGWLLCLACDTRRREGYDTMDKAVLELVRAEGLVAVPGARPPLNPDYKDAGRPLKRMLKQFGSGSLTAGVQQLRIDDKSCAEVARLLDVSPSTVREEVNCLPHSDLELNTLYQQLLQATGSSNSSTPARVSECTTYSSPSTRPGSARTTQAGAATPPAAAGAAAGAADAAGSSSAALSMHSPAAAALFRDLFQWYDKDNSGALEQHELQAALSDLGMLDGKSEAEAAATTEGYMRMADAAAHAQGQGVPFEAFCRLYETLVLAQARQQLRFKLGLQAEGDIKAIFTSFAGFGTREAVSGMSSASFLKLCRDCKLLDKQTVQADADLIFASVKTKGARKITFDEFLTALLKLAERKAVPFETLVMDILRAHGPVVHTNVQPEFVRLHDDKSTFSGVSRGGPSSVDRQVDAAGPGLVAPSQVVDRSLPESARGGAVSPTSPGLRRASLRSIGEVRNPSRSGSARRLTSPTTSGARRPTSPTTQGLGSRALSATNSVGNTTPFASLSGLSAVAQQLAPPRTGPQPAASVGPSSRRASAADAYGMTGQGRRSVGTASGIGGGSRSPPAAAALYSLALDDQSSRAAEGLLFSSSNDAACLDGRLSPDRDTAGEPTAAAVAPAAGAAAADAVGTTAHEPHTAAAAVTPPLGGSSGRSSWRLQAGGIGACSSSGSSRRYSRDAGGSRSSAAVAAGSPAGKYAAATAAGALTSPGGARDLQDVFTAFAGFGVRSPGILPRKSGGGAGSDTFWQRGEQEGTTPAAAAQKQQLPQGMDGFRFVKLCREAGLFDGEFTSISADIIFAKVKDKGAKKITYAQFQQALDLIAAEKKAAPRVILDHVLHCGGPVHNSSVPPFNRSVVPDSVRVHDSR